MITVYEKDHCPQCLTVKGQFKSAGVPFKARPIDEEILAYAREKGWRSAPVVIVDDAPELSFSGAGWLDVSAVIDYVKGEE